jgi:opacity protein-like surface antigen
MKGAALKKLLVSGIILGSLAAPAMATDLAVKAPPPAPYLWNGFYVGLNAGYADEQSTFTTAATGTPDAALGVLTNITESLAALSSGRIPTGNGMGFIGGGQVGYRPRWPLHTHQGRRLKAGKERNRGRWGTRASRARYGELVGAERSAESR